MEEVPLGIKLADFQGKNNSETYIIKSRNIIVDEGAQVIVTRMILLKMGIIMASE